MKHARHREGKTAFDLIEEATHLVRAAPVATLAIYYLGTIPFVLGLLFFWADMSRNPFAPGHLAEASFAMCILFFWMKFWQVIFARRIRAQIAVEPPIKLNPRRIVKIVLTQSILQPLGLFLIPLSAIPLLPFAWIYAFYQNATALDTGGENAAKLLKKSWRQAALWPKQNNYALAILLAFGFYVFLSWAAFCFTLPELVKMLFGVESVFTKSRWALLNTTFFAAMFGLTYLCADPILKTFYVLRCFYGESVESGEDLKAELKSFSIPAQKIATLILISLTIFISTVPAKAADTATPAKPQRASQVSPSDLDKAINQTIHERKYTWRMPREKIAGGDENEGVVTKFFNNIGAMIRKWMHSMAKWLNHWLQKFFHHRQPNYQSSSSGWDWVSSVQLLLWTLVAVAAAVLGVFLYRVWRNRQRSRAVIKTEAILPTPDVADENVGADQLPEDGWTKLGRELLARGEFRLAMRAFYLASLAHLASRNLISIARFKSNRDYERELRRRGHSFPELLSVFGHNISLFEGIWYGMHDVNFDLVNQFASNVERIKSAE